MLGKKRKKIVFFSEANRCRPNEKGFAEVLVIIPPFFYQSLVSLIPVLPGKKQSSGAVPPLQAVPALLDYVCR